MDGMDTHTANEIALEEFIARESLLLRQALVYPALTEKRAQSHARLWAAEDQLRKLRAVKIDASSVT